MHQEKSEEGEFCSVSYQSVLDTGNLKDDLEENGFVILQSALTKEFCLELKEKFRVQLSEAIANPNPNSFSKILNRYNIFEGEGK
jgi:hypothetical protein